MPAHVRQATWHCSHKVLSDGAATLPCYWHSYAVGIKRPVAVQTYSCCLLCCAWLGYRSTLSEILLPDTTQAKEVGGQAGDAVEQGANTAADKAEEAGSAAEDYSKTGQKQVTF
jgi:hypothetical protein